MKISGIAIGRREIKAQNKNLLTRLRGGADVAFLSNDKRVATVSADRVWGKLLAGLAPTSNYLALRSSGECRNASNRVDDTRQIKERGVGSTRMSDRFAL